MTEHRTAQTDQQRQEEMLFLPFFAQLEQRLRKGRVILAVEGGSASGKTTLSQQLEQRYDCLVFHMDDFFLQPAQRTAERYAEPGGNVDRERFLKEVLQPLTAGEKIAYRRFDCSTMTLQPPVILQPKRLNVVEGAYCMHPELASCYDISIFLEIEDALQKKRIQKRNTPEKAERFFQTWIPMERRYFEEMQVKERCDMVLRIS